LTITKSKAAFDRNETAKGGSFVKTMTRWLLTQTLVRWIKAPVKYYFEPVYDDPTNVMVSQAFDAKGKEWDWTLKKLGKACTTTRVDMMTISS
jgi:hypothetical protein